MAHVGTRLVVSHNFFVKLIKLVERSFNAALLFFSQGVFLGHKNGFLGHKIGFLGHKNFGP
jgi:hypothetical protein